MDCSMPGVPVLHHLLRFAQVHVRCIGEDVQPSHPLMLSSPSALSLSQHQGLSQWVLHSHQMTKIMELQLQHQSFQWIFRKIDCFDLLAVQGTFRSVIQQHSSKASILWHSSFFTVQLSQLYTTTGKTISIYCINLMKELNIYICHWANKDLKTKINTLLAILLANCIFVGHIKSF